MRFDAVHSISDLARLIDRVGMIPIFTCSIPGWSVEEHCDPRV